jgi:hypothetical protein
LSQRARSLQIRLNHGGVDPVTAATEASRIFFDSGDTVRSRWLGFELNGYGYSVDAAPLHEVLSVPPHDRLAVQVTAYRTQRGRVTTLDGQVVEFRHFFVEPLRDLLSTRARVAEAGGGPVELQFAVSPATPDHPLHGSFSPDVFDRVVGGFVAALHLQLATVPTMDLDDLNKSVTHAILQAEAFPRGSWEAQHAFREVADLEEEVATIAGAGVVDGEIARLGAVTAAMSAGEPLRAIQLGARYLADELSATVRARLEELVNEGNAEIDREAADGPSVAPIRFNLRAA